MKRTLLLVLLLVISLGTVSVFASSIYKEHDNVTFKETVLYGDRSIANGLKVELNTHHASLLFWNTTSEFEGDVNSSTDYHFYSTRQDYTFPEYVAGISMHCNPDGTFFLEEENPTGLSAAYQEVFDSLAPGQEIEKTIYLKDYMDYYNFELSFDFPNCHQYGNTSELDIATSDEIKQDPVLKALHDIKEYFKIPVLDTETYTISIGKHTNGNIASSGGGNTDSERFYMQTFSIVTDDTCFFTFKPHTTEGNLVDLSDLPEGYGLYALPFERVSDDIQFDLSTVKTDQISMVYPLDPNVQITDMTLDETNSRIFLYTEDQEQLWLTVLDIATMSTVQKFALCNTTDSWQNVYNYTDFIAVFNSNPEEITLFSLNETNEYELEFRCAFKPEGLENSYCYPSELAYDGKRLACSSTLRNYTYGNKNYCDYFITVYDSDGLQYWVEFENSLDSGLDQDWYDYPCKSDDYNALRLSWK